VPEPVLIVGAGPVGMTLALELERHGARSILVERKEALEAVGSRAIVIARHAIDTFRRLGCGDQVVEKGVALARARTYYRNVELFCIDFPSVRAGETPRFLNLQQTYTERFLLQRIEQSNGVEVLWGSEVTELEQTPSGVRLMLGAGRTLRGSYVVACDGAHSVVRKRLGIPFTGATFHDRFLIADIRAQLDFPRERRFFFDPPSNPGRQILIHPQPDDEWRIDWQVPSETDAEAERASGRLDARIRALIGASEYELVWLTAYRFHERLADRFRVGGAFLAGDAAHLFAPFGARGMNSGVEDARNLGWKLAYVVAGEAPEALLETYETERRSAAEENLRVTSATMRFMAPPTVLHRALRTVVLRGSVRLRPLRRFVDSGKLAEPAVYGSGENGLAGRLAPGADDSLADALGGGFALVSTAGPVGEVGAPVVEVRDPALVSAYGPGTVAIVRPDGYVAAQLRAPDVSTVSRELRRAVGAR
jgi:2-polyprenyl-6-methoxyphenol hydroxylase-like FAD-dependent oxidoreductase